MKKTGILLALLLLVMTMACACAQELPGVDCFSPGFVELNERMKQGQAVSAEAQPADGQTVQAAFDSAVRALSTRLYAQLGEKTKQAIADGL